MNVTSESRQNPINEAPHDWADAPFPYSAQFLGGLTAGAAVYVLDTQLLPAWETAQEIGQVNEKIFAHQKDLTTLESAEKLLSQSGDSDATAALGKTSSDEKHTIASLTAEKNHIGNEAVAESQVIGIPLAVFILTTAFLIRGNRRKVREYRQQHSNDGR